MNRLESNRPALWRLLFAAIISASPALSPAGEPIIIPAKNNKSASPFQPTPASREPVVTRQKAQPFDVLNVPGIARPSESDQIIEDKRHRLKRLERQNWMVVEQGELQEEEEAKNFLGVRDYSVEDIDKERNSENLMFRRMKKDDDETEDDRRTHGQPRTKSRSQLANASGKDKSRHPNLRREQQDDLDVGSFRDGDLRDSAERAKELPIKATAKTTFKGLFEPEQTGDSMAPKFNKSDLRLPGLLQSTVDPATVRQQEASREEFRAYLNKGTAPLTGPRDPINTRSDLTRQPMNPTTPQQPFAAQGPATGGNPFGPPSDVKGSPLSANLPAMAPRAPVVFSGGPFATPQNPARSSQQPTTFEIPKRKF